MLSLQGYFYNSGIIALIVLLWLSLYLIGALWVFVYRFVVLGEMRRDEQISLSAIMSGKSNVPNHSFFQDRSSAPREWLLIWKNDTLKRTTLGLSFLSIIASTAPFIGLFGTVVEILDAFGKLGGGGQISFDAIAPIISQALVATAAGILVAIPAYSFFLVLKRRAFDVNILVQMQVDALEKK